MDPQSQFCHDLVLHRTRVGWDRATFACIVWPKHRYLCTTCGRTFAATRGTPFYRKRIAH